MTQAETTNTTSRRRFLGAAAVAALAGAPAVVEAAAPNDPTFDLILQHRRAAITYEDLVADYCRRERILVDEGIGLYPYTSVALPAGQPIVVYNHERIDTLACLSEPQRRKAHADLDAALNRYTEVMGDAEERCAWQTPPLSRFSASCSPRPRRSLVFGRSWATLRRRSIRSCSGRTTRLKPCCSRSRTRSAGRWRHENRNASARAGVPRHHDPKGRTNGLRHGSII